MMTLNVRAVLLLGAVGTGLALGACAGGQSPSERTVRIPAPASAQDRQRAFNENAESIMVVPLGKDVLIPQAADNDPLPTDRVGPYELRNETLAAALQLVLDGYDIPMAFETDKGLTQKVTVSNLSGSLDKVVDKICSLANLYCLYNDGILTIKETQTFTVSLPPLDLTAGSTGGATTATTAEGGGGTAGAATTGGGGGFSSLSAGLTAIIGTAPVIDNTTRTMIYTATARTADRAKKYFDRLRTSTAMIVYETYIWEVSLSGGNSAGIKWDELKKIGKYNMTISTNGAASTSVGSPISIGLPTVSATPTDILEFISAQGATKTISQPQISMISGTSANLKVGRQINYVKSLTRSEPTTTNTSPTISTEVATVDTGLDLNISSTWDDATVYGAVAITVNADPVFKNFSAGTNTLSLPEIASRTLSTQVRVRPGDTILIAGIVSETQRDNMEGLGTERPWLPTTRTKTSDNSELVFMLRPRVIVFKPEDQILAEQQKTLEMYNPESKQRDEKPVEEKAIIPEKPETATNKSKQTSSKATKVKTTADKASAKAASGQAAPKKKPEPIIDDAEPMSGMPLRGTVPQSALDPAGKS